ncbi:MAG: hypothetical protein ACMXYF_00305 [Candidatus Woesearchaeota archaeon]
MKCAITGKPIEKTFLDKLIGTVIKDENGKKYYVSAQAQQKYKTKAELLKQLSSK